MNPLNIPTYVFPLVILLVSLMHLFYNKIKLCAGDLFDVEMKNGCNDTSIGAFEALIYFA